MIKITLACAAGMSTSLLVSKMGKYALANEIDVEIIAVPEKQFEKYADSTDILLLGPQVSFLLKKCKAAYEPKGIKVAAIPVVDYGRMNGEKVLKLALSL